MSTVTNKHILIKLLAGPKRRVLSREYAERHILIYIPVCNCVKKIQYFDFEENKIKYNFKKIR